MSRTGRCIETESRSVAVRLGMDGWEMSADRYRVSFGGEEDVLELDGGDDCRML